MNKYFNVFFMVAIAILLSVFAIVVFNQNRGIMDKCHNTVFIVEQTGTLLQKDYMSLEKYAETQNCKLIVSVITPDGKKTQYKTINNDLKVERGNLIRINYTDGFLRKGYTQSLVISIMRQNVNSLFLLALYY